MLVTGNLMIHSVTSRYYNTAGESCVNICVRGSSRDLLALLKVLNSVFGTATRWHFSPNVNSISTMPHIQFDLKGGFIKGG